MRSKIPDVSQQRNGLWTGGEGTRRRLRLSEPEEDWEEKASGSDEKGRIGGHGGEEER